MSVVLIILMSLTVCITVNGNSIHPAVSCPELADSMACRLPACRCHGHHIPANLSESHIPQIVFLTFDDAVNWANFDFYLETFSSRRNPNGHPVSVTFFVSHEYTDYSMVHQLYSQGHEIALHSITHQIPSTYWQTLDHHGWSREVAHQRDQMSYFGKIPKEEIRGMRAPFLQGGGDAMYSALGDAGLIWESSRPSNNVRLWPYTNDFASLQECAIPPCHVGSYPGFWTVPMVEYLGGKGDLCSMVDACQPVPETPQDTLMLLKSNFLRHYNGNKAPFGVFAHSAWLNGDGTGGISPRRKGYILFLDYLASLEDVYIVGVSQAMEWIKTPIPLDHLKTFRPFHVEVKETECAKKYTCHYRPDGGTEKWFTSCQPCPSNYPWLGNPFEL